jgi:hypothetical protein
MIACVSASKNYLVHSSLKKKIKLFEASTQKRQKQKATKKNIFME